ncbi:alkaline phosphatase family protein [Paenibacillus xerothermodurans]|uniref:Alkaline phosphatase family protein n=1 Tax=Paenibacillus xerothermodurans TaxID=1977292 RepID=A0A2W1NA82_PAEXE|nr:alkaline phosphatase family protein [Paenibacillus xerothermodurans]
MVVLDVISLTQQMLDEPELTPNIRKLLEGARQCSIRPVFPAVTGTAQATYITGEAPSGHGIICNGLMDRNYKEVTMWNQTMVPVQGAKLWEKLKKEDPEAKTAVLFWQFSKLTTADYVVTPAPIHLEDKMILWCDSKPRDLYPNLAEKYGEFDLKTFWGPLASVKSSEWIAQAALDVLDEYRPRLSLVYLPNLDYHAQRFGPDSEQVRQAVKELDSVIGGFVEELERRGLRDETRIVLLSEYSFKPVNRPVYINRLLNENGYVAVNRVQEMDFADIEKSAAFALADHQIAHVYVPNPADISAVKELLLDTPGIAEVWGEQEKRENRIDHPGAGELIAIAEPDSWFVYYWWLDNERAPDFAHTVDIHRKPGYDPVELFVDMKTYKIPLEPDRIRGSHGLPARGAGDLVSMIVTGRDIDLPEQMDATDVHEFLLNLAIQAKGVTV